VARAGAARTRVFAVAFPPEGAQNKFRYSAAALAPLANPIKFIFYITHIDYGPSFFASAAS